MMPTPDPARTGSRGPARAGRLPARRRVGGPGLRLAGLLAVLVAGGIPFVAYLWETLNELLALHVDPRRLLISGPLLVLFVALLRAVGRTLARLDQTTTPTGD